MASIRKSFSIFSSIRNWMIAQKKSSKEISLQSKYEISEISIFIPTFEGGGAERVAINLANYFSSKNIAVNLVCFRNIGIYKDLISPKIDIIELKVKRTRYAAFHLLKYVYSTRSHIYLSICQDFNFPLGILGFFVKPKALIIREASTIENLLRFNQLIRWIYCKFLKISYFNAAHLICNSESTKEGYVKKKLIPEEKCSVIHNPVFELNFNPLSFKNLNDPWCADESLKVCLAVGRLEKPKDFEYLINIFSEVSKRNPKARLIIVGSGSLKNHLLNIISKLKCREKIKIVNFTQHIYYYYKSAHLFVQTPSWEGFGNVLVEAMIFGLPVISSDCVGGPRDILANGQYGKLIDKNNKDEFVNELLLELSLQKRNINENIERAKQFSVKAIGKKYEECLSKCI